MLEGGSKTGVDSDSRNNNRWLSLPLADEVSVSQSGVSVGVSIEARGTLRAAVLKGGSKTRVDSDSRDNNGWLSLPLANEVSVDSVVGSIGSIGEETRGTLWATVLKGSAKVGVDSDSWNNNGWLSLPLADQVSVSQSWVTVVSVEARGTLRAAVLKRGSKTRVDGNSRDNDGSIGLGNSEGSEGNDSGLQKMIL